MAPLNTVPLIALSPLLGLLAGFIVARIAEEELKPGRKYFVLLQYFVTSALITVILWNANSLMALLAGILLLTYFVKREIIFSLFYLPVISVPVVLAPQTTIAAFICMIVSGTLHWKEKTELLAAAIAYSLVVVCATIS